MPPVPRREAAPPRRALATALVAAAALTLAACSGGGSTGSSASGTGPAGAATTGSTAGREAAASTRPPATSAAPASSAVTTTTARRPARHVFPVQPVAGCGVHYGHVHHDYPATDIFARKGCRFVSPTDGMVTEVSRTDRWQPSTDRGADRGGRSVAVLGDDGVRYYGSHLESVEDGIAPGARVRAGQTLGRIDNSGDARYVPTHLHFGISWPTRDGVWWVRRGTVYPWPYLDSWRAGGNRSPALAVRAALAAAGRRVPPCHSGC
ncbi:MAG TPA: M23 family metallopeptidase [Actinomycetes bacterium]